MSYSIRADKLSEIKLNEPDAVASVIQNIAVILSTPQGSVPLYREFGLNQDFRDRPINVAQTMAVSRIREAIELFEPRAEVVDISFDQKPDGTLIPIVEVNINVA